MAGLIALVSVTLPSQLKWPVDWSVQLVNASAVVLDGKFTVTDAIAPTNNFFRLHKP